MKDKKYYIIAIGRAKKWLCSVMLPENFEIIDSNGIQNIPTDLLDHQYSKLEAVGGWVERETISGRAMISQKRYEFDGLAYGRFTDIPMSINSWCQNVLKKIAQKGNVIIVTDLDFLSMFCANVLHLLGRETDKNIISLAPRSKTGDWLESCLVRFGGDSILLPFEDFSELDEVSLKSLESLFCFLMDRMKRSRFEDSLKNLVKDLNSRGLYVYRYFEFDQMEEIYWHDPFIFSKGESSWGAKCKQGIVFDPDEYPLQDISEDEDGYQYAYAIHNWECSAQEMIDIMPDEVATNMKKSYDKYATMASVYSTTFRAIDEYKDREIKLIEALDDVESEKQQTEELMQWIAHSTNSDLTSLELSVKREHAVNSQVLTQRIRQDVETFSLMSSDSDAFMNAVKQDIVGTKSLYDVICESVISTMLFMLSPKARDQKLINHRYFNYAQRQGLSQDMKRQDWVKSPSFSSLQKEMFTNFLSAKDDNVAALSWIAEHFGNIAITIDDAIHLQMSEHGKKAAVLAYIFKQFTSNAMKYGVADANEDMLSIQCNINSDSYALTCFNQALPRRIQMGNNKGLKAMNVMLSKLRQPELAIQEKSHNYSISCFLSRDLMGG